MKNYACMKNKAFPNRFRQRYAFIFLLSVLCVMLTGCQIFASKIARQYHDGIPGNTHLAMLPFINHIEVPEEEVVQLKRILKIQLAAAGVTNTTAFQKSKTTLTPSYLSDIYELEQAQLWAKHNNVTLSILGEVLEWQYDEQNRFSTALQLKVIHIDSGEVIWSINGFSEGRPDEAAYDVSRKLITDLVAAMPVQKPK